MTRYDAFFRENWALLQQVSLYRPEPNPTFENPAFEAAPFRALIVRLSPFRDVDRSTPHLFLFQAVRRAVPESYVDMAFFPPAHDRDRMLAAVPLLVGIQSWRDASDFDVVLVSNAYTLELINLPYLLIHTGLAALASEREASAPPVILGGSNALATQALITSEGDGAPDAIFFGEGEEQVATLVAGLAANAGEPKSVRLARAAEQVGGLWLANVPVDQTVRKAVCAHPQAEDLLTDYPTLDGDEAATARLQVSFGCPAFCSFCFEGYDRKPYRELDHEALVETARKLKRQHGVEALDLYSFNFNTHRDVLALMMDLNRTYDWVGLKSQRVDMLAAMPALLEAEVLADNRSFTLGIEGISRRMRAFLHKSLSDAEIENVLVRLFGQKIREIKLFYILTGHETEADLAEFHDFVVHLRALRRQGGAKREGDLQRRDAGPDAVYAAAVRPAHARCVGVAADRGAGEVNRGDSRLRVPDGGAVGGLCELPGAGDQGIVACRAGAGVGARGARLRRRTDAGLLGGAPGVDGGARLLGRCAPR
jgi:hypothetical protein